MYIRWWGQVSRFSCVHPLLCVVVVGHRAFLLCRICGGWMWMLFICTLAAKCNLGLANQIPAWDFGSGLSDKPQGLSVFIYSSCAIPRALLLGSVENLLLMFHLALASYAYHGSLIIFQQSFFSAEGARINF